MKCSARLLAMVVSCCVSVVGIPAWGQTSYPMLMSLHPTAAQTGQSSEHTIKSRYTMYGADRVLVTGEGVTGEIIHPERKASDQEKRPNLQTMKVRFTVADDALPGVRDFRIVTPQGVSTLGQLVIVSDPVVVETGKNDTVADAQPVSVPGTICGVIEKAEDVDVFKFRVEKPSAWSFHVRSMRLQNRIHDLQQHSDPILTLRNSVGGTLAASDNHFYGDPFLGYRFDEPGEYLLEIRDVRYQGNQYWEYSIEVSDRPFVSNVFPMGVAPGETAELAPVGFQIPADMTVSVDIPADFAGDSTELRLPMDGGRTNPVPIVACDLPMVVESGSENTTAMDAEPVSLPGGINGRIEASGDVDCFAFEAKKGEKYSFEVIARRRQSGLDSHLRILDADGKQLTLNDDMKIGVHSFADSQIENWTVPADGKYVIEIRDLHLRGGPEFVYFVKATRSEPYFRLFADTDKTQLTPGTSGVVFVRVERKNGFDGPVELQVDGLPEGVTAECGRILGGKGTDGCIVFTADVDASPTAANISILGTSTFATEDSEQTLSATATPYQETYQPGGGRGHWPVQMHTVSVGAPSDIRLVELSRRDVVLKPGESQKIDIKIDRVEGFDKNVTLDVIYKHLSRTYGDSLPEGVSLDAKNSKTLLTGKTIEGHITLKAADNAPPSVAQMTAVMANVSLNFVMKATYASQALRITVAEKE